jgi:hypothetical protein
MSIISSHSRQWLLCMMGEIHSMVQIPHFKAQLLVGC